MGSLSLLCTLQSHLAMGERVVWGGDEGGGERERKGGREGGREAVKLVCACACVCVCV